MKNKFKYLTIVIFVILIFGLTGCSNNIQPDSEFNTEFNQCKKIIEDTSTAITDDQINIIEEFENKNLYSNNTEFKNQFLPFLEEIMREGLTSKNVNYIDKLIASSRITYDTNEKIKGLRIELIDRSNSLLSYSTRDDTHATVVSLTPVEPTIGMTKLQVNNSTWGTPESKNITNSSKSGESEQWVYTKYRYIYFEEGIVTAIQTH